MDVERTRRLLPAFSFQPLALLNVAKTITDTNYLAHGVNIGWINTLGGVANVAAGCECAFSRYVLPPTSAG